MSVILTANRGYSKQEYEDQNWHTALNDTLDAIDLDVQTLIDTKIETPDATAIQVNTLTAISAATLTLDDDVDVTGTLQSTGTGTIIADQLADGISLPAGVTFDSVLTDDISPNSGTSITVQGDMSSFGSGSITADLLKDNTGTVIPDIDVFVDDKVSALETTINDELLLKWDIVTGEAYVDAALGDIVSEVTYANLDNNGGIWPGTGDKTNTVPKASDVVDISTDQSIAGIKTFSVLPRKSGSMVPSSDGELATKYYVDTEISSNLTDVASEVTYGNLNVNGAISSYPGQPNTVPQAQDVYNRIDTAETNANNYAVTAVTLTNLTNNGGVGTSDSQLMLASDIRALIGDVLDGQFSGGASSDVISSSGITPSDHFIFSWTSDPGSPGAVWVVAGTDQVSVYTENPVTGVPTYTLHRM